MLGLIIGLFLLVISFLFLRYGGPGGTGDAGLPIGIMLLFIFVIGFILTVISGTFILLDFIFK